MKQSIQKIMRMTLPDPIAMTVDDLVQSLRSLQQQGLGHLVVGIPFTPPHATLGKTPTVAVQSVHSGFDWDAGKVHLIPSQPLGVFDQDQRRYALNLENDLQHLLRSIRSITKSDLFSPEERLREIEQLLETSRSRSPSKSKGLSR